MTTDAQIRANRENAQRSTGPTTEEGKQASRLNAMTHGLLANTAPFLPTESEEEYRAFRAEQLADLQPKGAFEERLFEEIIDLTWRLRRASKLELGVLTYDLGVIDERWLTDRRRRFEVTNRDILVDQAFPNGGPDDVAVVTNEHAHDQLGMLIDDAVAATRHDESRVAAAFIEDASGANAMTKLARYETALFRRRNQLLALFADRQRARQGAGEAKAR